MIECGANEVPEDVLQKALDLAAVEVDKSCDMQADFLAKLVIKEQAIMFNKPSEDVITYISNILTTEKLEALTGNTKIPFGELFSKYQDEALEIAKDKIADNEAVDFDTKKVKM